MFCSFDAPNKVDRVGVSAHNPGTLAGVTTHILQNKFAGIQTATKHVRPKTKKKESAHKLIDLGFEENVFRQDEFGIDFTSTHQVVHCLQLVELLC